MRNIFLTSRFFFFLGLIAIGFILSFIFVEIAWLPQTLLILLLIILLVDYGFLYFKKQGITAARILPEKLSNGDQNQVQLKLQNLYPFPVRVTCIDEVPFQFQERHFRLEKKLPALAFTDINYEVLPLKRGLYNFGAVNAFVRSWIGFFSRRYRLENGQEVVCYPSFVHLQKYELMAFNDHLMFGGQRKLRKLGQTMEFEQIKEYVAGDDVRNINWKATAKSKSLMVNQYDEEKSQKIYLILDKGRSMQMPFEEMSLLDYSVNAAMALSHIILKKSDKPGLLTFNKSVDQKVAAESRGGQMRKIADTLYELQTDFAESDFSRLYMEVRSLVRQRSLLILFTNFETFDGLKRQLKYLRAIAKNHVLVVVFFKNSEIQKILEGKPTDLQGVYDQIIAEKFEYEKKLIINELRKHGIYSLYTAPQDLSMESIRLYLEMKNRGKI